MKSTRGGRDRNGKLVSNFAKGRREGFAGVVLQGGNLSFKEVKIKGRKMKCSREKGT